MASFFASSYSGIRSKLEMFSVSFNPEIVSFFWKSCPPTPSIDPNQAVGSHAAQPTQLIQLCLPSEPEDGTLFSTIQSTFVTTGILAVVGVGSFCTFKLLQCIRQGRPPSLQNVKRFVVEASRPFILHWRKSPSQCGTTSQDITPIRHSTISNGQLSKRPSELPLTNWSPRGNRQFHTSRETSLERRLLTKDRTPLADCDIASGEEDINDIQGQYFGPTMKSSTMCMELLGSSPEDSPIHALTLSRGTRMSPKKRLGREDSC